VRFPRHMLHCKRQYAAMQTNGLLLESGIHRLPPDHDAAIRCASEKGTTMSKTASMGFAPSNSLLGRLMATIDRLLMASARAAVRNGDLPYFGL
jgi:hypothetical protein